MKKMLLCVMTFSLSFFACEKEEHIPSHSELLTGGSSKTWVVKRVFMGGEEITEAIFPCALDDNYIFRSDATFEVNEGETKCYTSEPQISESGTWLFIQSNSKIVRISEELTDTVSIARLTETELHIIAVNNGEGSELRLTGK